MLSFYYQPDLCAGSFRCTALIEQLRLLGTDIELITTLPNRYASFSADAPEHEKYPNLEIHRIKLPSHQSGMLDQVKAFHAFYRAAKKLSANKQYDMVFATSSRLFTAFLGARIADRKKLPLYLDIRDIFVDTINDVLSPKISWLVKPVFSMLEKYTFSSAKRINLVSEGFRSYFQDRYPSADYRWFTNGIDQEFLDAAPSEAAASTETKKQSENAKVKLLYAGNLGEGQGLHTILPAMAQSLKDKITIKVIGDGGRKEILRQNCEGLSNIELLPPVNRHQLIAEYQQADILFLHLNDYPAFTKVLPSKIFEYAALGKPILAGVSGYAADFLKSEVTNSSVFYPGDHEQAVSAFNQLEIRDIPRPSFINKFARKNITAEMADDIIEFSQRYGRN